MENSMIKGQVSVIMSVYNSEDYLSDCIRSVLNQTYNNMEFIIIDDASTDESYNIIEKYAEIDKRIKVIRNTVNKGLTYNLNRAIEMSQGEYIARMDSDDISLPRRFEKQVSFLDKNSDVDICGSWVYLVDSETKLKFNAKRPCSDQQIKEQMIFGNPMTHPSVMMRKCVFEKVKYDETFRTMQDYKLWTDLSDKKFHNIPEYLLLYRINEQGITKTERKKKSLRVKTASRIYREFFEKMDMRFDDDDIYLFSKSMHIVEKFTSVSEAKKARKLIKRIIELYPESNRNFAYSRWALTCSGNMWMRMPWAYGKGIFYRGLEIAKMIPRREDYRRVEEWHQN